MDSILVVIPIDAVSILTNWRVDQGLWNSYKTKWHVSFCKRSFKFKIGVIFKSGSVTMIVSCQEAIGPSFRDDWRGNFQMNSEATCLHFDGVFLSPLMINDSNSKFKQTEILQSYLISLSSTIKSLRFQNYQSFWRSSLLFKYFLILLLFKWLLLSTFWFMDQSETSIMLNIKQHQNLVADLDALKYSMQV